MGNNLGKITADQYQALKRELGDLSQRTDISLYYGIKGVQNSVNWKFVDGDVLSKIDSVFPHVRTIEGIKFKNNKWGFEGMHVERGLEEFVQANPGSRYELLNKVESPTGIYTADPKIILADGTELFKLNNQGKSTFFPRNWTDARIKEEVEHAVRYNEGIFDSTKPWEGYYGFSKDGSVKIRFYYDENTGYIASYFPQK